MKIHKFYENSIKMDNSTLINKGLIQDFNIGILSFHAKVLIIGWLVCCLLAGPDLWKRMPLKCYIIMVFTCPLLS